MARQDEFGIWREDDYRSAGPKPARCPHCRAKDLDYDRGSEFDDIDGELMDAWGDKLPFDPDELDHESETFFSFMPLYAVCEECNTWTPYGDIAYFNPATIAYDLTRPLTPEAAEQAAAEQIRINGVKAGQLPLFAPGTLDA